MSPTPGSYVVAISASSADSLTAYASLLAAALAGDPRSGRRAFPRAATLPAVAATLLDRRRCAPHRLAFGASTVADAVEKLGIVGEQTGDPAALAPQGLYANVVHRSPFDGGASDDRDRAYLRSLATTGRHDQLAKLWSVGFPIEWRHVYPDLVGERPLHLPPVPLDRRRYWPEGHTVPGLGPGIGVGAGTSEPLAPDSDPEPGSTPHLVAELTNLPRALRVARLRGYLQDRIAGVLGYSDGERPSATCGFFDLGMSSVHLEQVRRSIIADTGFAPGETSAFEHPTIAAFADHLARELAHHGGPGAGSAAAAADPGASPALHTMSQDDIDRLSVPDLERALAAALS